MGISRVQLRNITILLGSTLTVMAGAVVTPALPEIGLAFSGTQNAEFLVKLVLTLPALFIVLGAPFAGYALDRWGRKPVVLISLLLYGLSGTSGFFLDSLYSILISRALLGLAVAGVMSGFTTLITDYFSGPQLNRFMGIQGAFMGLGGMVFVLLAGYLADISWNYPFLVYLLSFIVLPGAIFTIDEPKRDIGEGETKESPPVKILAPIYIAAFFGMFIFFVFPVQLPFYLVGNVGVTSTQVGMALSIQTASSVIIALFYQKIKERMSFRNIFAFIVLMLGIAHLVVSSTVSYEIILVGLFIGGLGLGILPPNVQVWVASSVPTSTRGRSIGGLTTFLFLGQFFTPILTEPLVNSVGLGSMFWYIGLFAITIVLGILALNVIKK